MKTFIEGVKSRVRSAVAFVDRNARKFAAVVVGVGVAAFGGLARAQTDATVIATSVQSAFNIIAPIIVTIATFFAVLAIVKRVRRG